MIKRTFPNTKLPKPWMLRSIIQGSKKIYDFSGPMGYLNMNEMKTLRNTPFGRGMSLSLVDGVSKHYLFFFSDWQKEVVDQTKTQANIHLFIDGTFKWWPKIWSQLLNFSVYHREKKLYIPVGHALMQTKKREGYEIWIRWFKEKLGLKADYITTDFEPALMGASIDIFPNAKLVPWFFHFTKALWMEASRCGMKKRSLLPESKVLLFKLKKLAFIPKEKVIQSFMKIKDEYRHRHSYFIRFLEYFESTWIDGLYKISDWNYFDKLSEFEDLALTNNGLESFHQWIKTQLSRTQPNLPGFVETLKRVETLKKNDFDSDRIWGDPQYNRWWPATKIMRELYSKIDANSGEEIPEKKRDAKDWSKEDEEEKYIEENEESNHLWNEIEYLFNEFDDANILANNKYSIDVSLRNQKKKVWGKEVDDEKWSDELWSKIDKIRQKKINQVQLDENLESSKLDISKVLNKD